MTAAGVDAGMVYEATKSLVMPRPGGAENSGHPKGKLYPPGNGDARPHWRPAPCGSRAVLSGSRFSALKPPGSQRLFSTASGGATKSIAPGSPAPRPRLRWSSPASSPRRRCGLDHRARAELHRSHRGGTDCRASARRGCRRIGQLKCCAIRASSGLALQRRPKKTTSTPGSAC